MELKFIILKVALEIKEVVQNFSNSSFLGMTRESDGVGDEREVREHERLLE